MGYKQVTKKVLASVFTIQLTMSLSEYTHKLYTIELSTGINEIANSIHLSNFQYNNRLSVVLYIGIIKVRDFLSQNITPKPALYLLFSILVALARHITINPSKKQRLSPIHLQIF